MRTRSMVEKAVALAIAANAPLIALAQTSGSRELEEVTVTATRRESSLQDAPVAVQVYDESTLEALNVGSFADYLKYTPGMQGGGGVQPGTQFIEMRGIGAYGGNLAQAGTIGAKASVAVYLDETPVSAGASGTRNTDLYVTDINRVEVLAGPQGTLFGSASMSGAIRLISNKPNPENFDAKVSLQTGQTQGSDDLNYGVEAMVNLPIVQDRLAVRIAAYDVFNAGYLDNTPTSSTLAVNTRIVNDTTGKYANTQFGVLNNFDFQPKDMNTSEYKGARVSALFNITDEWRISAQYTNQKLETEGPFFYRDDIGDLKVARYVPEFLHDDVSLLAWNLEGRIAALDVIYSGSFLERDIEQVSDYQQYTQSGPFFPYYACDYPAYTHCEPPATDWTVTSDLRNVTHELRFASDPANRLSFIAGVYHHKNGCTPECGTSIEFNYYGAIAQGFPPNAPMPGAISYIPATRKPGTMFFTDMSPIVEETSFFGDITYKFTDRISASVGVRHYDIDQSAVGSVNFGSRTNPAAGVNFSDNLRPVNESDLIKRVNLQYSPSEHVRLYATYSEGFSTGGYNRTGGVPGFDGSEVPLSYDTETTTNYEIGWKTTFANQRARFNGAVFKIDWDGIVVGILDQTITNALFFVNAGEAQVRGIEGELAYLISDKWSIEGAFAVTDSELKAIPSTVRNIVPVGSQLARQPVLAGNVRLRYDFNLMGSEAYATLGSVYMGSRYNGVAPTRTKSPAYTIYDLNLGAKWNEKWEAKLFVHNLFNDRYEVSRGEVPSIGWINKTIGRPRTVGFSVAYDF